jgi:micrococcal nuclease
VGGPTGETEEALVTSVADGDTIRVSIGTRDYRVRYIGIDAPELDRAGQPAESFARESLAANRELVKDQTVTLEKDVSETDRFGRLLRYVWLQDGGSWLMVNAQLVRLGFAHAGTYPPDVKYTDVLRRAEQEARDSSAGLWADSSLVINPIAQPIPTRQAPQPPAKDCDPSYPDVCIPPAPPDLDCGDVPYDNIRVTGRDPHGFDGNGDGVGCES